MSCGRTFFVVLSDILRCCAANLYHCISCSLMTIGWEDGSQRSQETPTMLINRAMHIGCPVVSLFWRRHLEVLLATECTPSVT
ncbi:hypothetical protein BV20DRAFT_104299 [Pilatotrama ljubarskyi]|nr:hypothetical protein BV20DRAFT_104299 [Pilatotrama ljubarskyi]